MHRSNKSLILADTLIQEGDIWKVEINKRNKFFLVSNQNLFIIEPARLEGSCLINNYLIRNPRLYSISKFDPLLLMVPILLDNKLKFRDLSDLLQESKLGFFHNKKFLDLETICDVTLHEGNKYFRINLELYKVWISNKLQALAEYLIKTSAIIHGSPDLNVAGRKLAIGIIVQFLPVDVVMDVDSTFTIEQVINVGRLFLKRIDEEVKDHSQKMKAKSCGHYEKKSIKPRKTEQSKNDKNQTKINFQPIKKK